ncbi:MAG: hypothetical protein KBE65_23300, partial [Phycisphaerae bacterium]|nr:hypothetical protein [Phycisphaerae bacterium]
YQIATAADLIALGETPADYDKHFVLTADIDLDPNLPGGKIFDKAVIAPDFNDVDWQFDGTRFSGAFDGCGHVISHLTIRGGSFLGLFGCVCSATASVCNVGLEAVGISGTSHYVGGLVGYNVVGCIAASYSTGSVTGDTGVGGLVGGNHVGSITTSYSTVAVDGNDSVGGLVGRNGGKIVASYSGGSVSGAGYDVGGMVGIGVCEYASSVKYGVSTGDAINCFWDMQTSGQGASAGGTGKTTAEMQASKTYLDGGWDFLGELTNGVEDMWWILEGRDYPHLWWEKVLGDDFEDGEAGPQWMVFEVDPDLVQIREVNGRLETTASAEAQNVDAFYVSQDWRLDVTQDFAIRVDYHFTETGGGDGRVTIGLLPSIEMPVTRWAEFEVGCFDSGPFYLYELRDEYWVQEQTSKRSADEGTLYVSYNPAADELYFSHTGYGKPNAWRTVTGLLKGRWAGEPVYVILGGGSEGLGFDGADAWLDNFAVQAGAILE